MADNPNPFIRMARALPRRFGGLDDTAVLKRVCRADIRKNIPPRSGFAISRSPADER